MAESAPGPVWLKSSFCGTSACVEVAKVADHFLIRDSKNPHAVLRLTEAEWVQFTQQVLAG